MFFSKRFMSRVVNGATVPLQLYVRPINKGIDERDDDIVEHNGQLDS